MGRHSAVEGAAADPVVAAALGRRPADAAGRHGDVRAEGTESGLGWPGASTTHEGLGWPGRTSGQDRVAEPDAGRAALRRGWRRLFRAA